MTDLTKQQNRQTRHVKTNIKLFIEILDRSCYVSILSN